MIEESESLHMAQFWGMSDLLVESCRIRDQSARAISCLLRENTRCQAATVKTGVDVLKIEQDG